MRFDELKVLVVDDYDTMLKILTNLLQQIGFKDIETAKDGSQALDLVNNNNFDLIISDWNMEPMSGLELLQKVRAHDRGEVKSVPFIMVTAESKPENVVVAKQHGVSNYIVKPFNAATLSTKINSVLDKVA